jgi:hypothetical protein
MTSESLHFCAKKEIPNDKRQFPKPQLHLFLVAVGKGAFGFVI